MQEESSRACTGCHGSTRAACSPPPARCPCRWVLGTHRAALQQQKKEDGEEMGRSRHNVCLSFQHLPVSPCITMKVTLPLSRRALCWCGFAAHQMELVPICTCSRSATSLGTGPGWHRRGWWRAQDHHQQDCSCRETFTGLSAITRPQSRRMQPVPSPTCCPAALNPAAAGRSVLLALQGHPAASHTVMMKLPGKISKNYT